jgi:phosphatidylglycerol:prolipoprotein diacylglycerol transferase
MIEFFPSRRVALDIFEFSIHWYGLLYLLAFLVAYWSLPRLQHHRNVKISKEEWSNILTAAILGVLVGGRLGYVFFYAPELIVHPLEIVKVWHGGMSSHGGFLGVGIAVGWYLYRKNLPILAIADVVVVPIAIGLAFGRLGNFVNLELYGTVTSLPWAMDIPGVEGARHPLQLYGIGKNLFIALICFMHLRSTSVSGKTFGVFLMLYGFLRFLLEYVREQSYAALSLGIVDLSRGQLLTIPLFVTGLLLWKYATKKGSTV